MNAEIKSLRLDGKKHTPFVGTDGIYCPLAIGNSVYYQCVVPKELFVEAYNKWIKNDSASKYACLTSHQCDDTDCWND